MRKRMAGGCFAKWRLEDMGVNFNRDYHSLRSEQVRALLDVAKAVKYRKPRNASGSRARMFFQNLKRMNCSR